MDKERNSCRVCDHPESRSINKALAKRVTHEKIGRQFGFSSRSIHRHFHDCIEGGSALDLRNHQRADAAFDYGAELLKHYRKNEKYAEAYEEWLSDPDDPSKFFVGPRGSEITIIYDDWNDLNERGNPTRKKAILQDLLRIVNGSKREVMAVGSLAADNRKLYLDCFRAISSSLQEIGKFLGLWKQEASKDKDAELENLRMIIQASADENGTTWSEEARILLALPVSSTIRPDLKAKLISDFEQ